jgi:hypothetical protein
MPGKHWLDYKKGIGLEKLAYWMEASKWITTRIMKCKKIMLG